MSLKARIREIYAQHKGRYGYRRITAVLRRTGQVVNHKTVQRLMQRLGLRSVIRHKRYRAYRGEIGTAAPNRLDRQFNAQRPNHKWVTDITEFQVNGQKLYLSPVMDLYNGEIVAYQMGVRPVLALVRDMLTKAFARLSPASSLQLHSDQGWHYRHPAYTKLLEQQGCDTEHVA